MAEATSSASSAYGDQYADQVRHMQQVMNGLKVQYPVIDRLDRISRNIHKEAEGLRLKVPDDIQVLVNKYAGWTTPRDVKSSREKYTRVRDGLKDPNFNIDKELEKLKGLSSALGSKCDAFAEECGQLSLKHGDRCESLVEKLVEQVPRIKDMPGYEDVTTQSEKRWIERALRKKGQPVKQGEDCKRHIELVILNRLYNTMSQTLEAEINQPTEFSTVFIWVKNWVSGFVIGSLKITLDDIYEKNPIENLLTFINTMAEATSSASSASGDQYADQVRHMQQVMNGLKVQYPVIDRIDRISRNIHKEAEGLRLKVPDDIQVLVNKYVGWDTPRDVKSSREMYTRVRDGLKDPNFNIEKELEKLKGLSSALGSKCDAFAEECGQLSLKHGDRCESLVEKLVEQVPRIKDMPGYEDVTTQSEKRWIERALRKKGQPVKQGEDCKRHLEDFRKEVKPMAEKVGEAYAQLGTARMLLHTVNEFIHILTTTKQRGFNMDKYNFGSYEKKRKRNTLESQGNVSREVDRKEVEESLLELLKKVSGKALESNAANTESMKKWDLIVNDFFLLSDQLRSCTG